jgi:hypothetical protein
LREHHRARTKLALGDLREAEVEHLREVAQTSVRRQEDVLGLEVAMNDALRVRFL